MKRTSAHEDVTASLYDVDFVDDDGFALIRMLRDASERITLGRCSNFVAELLQTEDV